MRPGKTALLIVGVLLALVGVGLVIGGGALVWVHATERDSNGYYSTPLHRFDSTANAITSDRIALLADAQKGDWVPGELLGTARLDVRSLDARPLFVGIGREADVDAYLSQTAHDIVVDVPAKGNVDYRREQGGSAAPAAPAAQTFWVASSTGNGDQSLTWKVKSGEWAVVVMNADGSPGVRVDASAGLKTGALLPIGLGLLAAGLVLGALAVTLIALAVQGISRSSVATGPATAERFAGRAAPTSLFGAGGYPVRFEAQLDSNLSRGLWLVKWLLAIPHFVVLAFLWIAFYALTFIAGISVLFTGKYPRSFFDFNVGVMRWTWRATFYAFVLGTDRYPPFSLHSEPSYPADLDVEYPERLSHGLVLVKWWLLALPHYLIISIFGGGLTWWTWSAANVNDQAQAAIGGGLIGLLALIAGVALLFTRRYPQSLFAFIMGMERWTYRVFAYAALMRDEYPPFRLDTGGSDEPVPVGQPPRPDREGGLATA